MKPKWFDTLREANVARAAEMDLQLGPASPPITAARIVDDLADLVIAADHLAMRQGLDLDAAVAQRFNQASIRAGLNARLTVADRPEPAGLAMNCDRAKASAVGVCSTCCAGPLETCRWRQ